jgi:hypothetical protein
MWFTQHILTLLAGACRSPAGGAHLLPASCEGCVGVPALVKARCTKRKQRTHKLV